MPTDNKPAAATPGAEKTFVAFFTTAANVAKGAPKVDLFKSLSDKPRAPLFSGKIDGVQTSAFLRKGPKGAFLSLVGDKGPDGKSADLGVANVGTRANGIPVLVIDLKKADGTSQTVFASISKQVDQAMLENIGMNVEKQAEKRATAAAKAAAVPEVPKKAAALKA